MPTTPLRFRIAWSRALIRVRAMATWFKLSRLRVSRTPWSLQLAMKRCFATGIRSSRSTSSDASTSTLKAPISRIRPRTTFSLTLQLQIQNYNALQYPLYTILEIRVVRGTDVRYLGVTNAQVNNATGIITLDPTDMAYITVGDGITQAIAPLVLNGVPANNQTLVGQLAAAASSYQFQVFARFQTGINYFPTLQPVLSVASVTGNGATGVVT